MNHKISMGVKRNLISVLDTTNYTPEEPQKTFGRAYFITLNGSIVSSNLSSPMVSSHHYTYGVVGSYEAMVFFFPFWDAGTEYSTGDIVLANSFVGEIPGVLPDRGPAALAPRLFVANSDYVDGDIPATSLGWDYLDNDIDNALTQCNDSVDDLQGVLVTANVYADELFSAVTKIADYVYQISTYLPEPMNVKYYTLEGYLKGTEIKPSEPITDLIAFDTRVLLGHSNMEIIVVEGERDNVKHYWIVYEVSQLVNNVNGLIKTLYCIDNPDIDCRGITPKTEEHARKSMTVLMTLYFSILYKLNHKHSKAVYIGTIGENALTLVSEASKELKRIQVTLNTIDYVTIDRIQ